MERKIFMKIFFDYKIFYKQYWGGRLDFFYQMAQNMHKLDKEIYIYSPIYVNKYLKTFKKIYPNLVNGTYLKKK